MEVEGQKAVVEGQTEELKTVSPEQFKELQERLATFESTNARLLEESRENANKYRKVRDSVEEREKADMEAKGQIKELLEIEKNKRHDAEKRAVLKTIDFEVSSLAPEAHDIKDVINALRLSEDDINFETAEVSGLSAKVDDLRKSKPWLFKQVAPGMNQKMPYYKEQKTEVSKEQKLNDAFKTLLKK